MLLNRMWYAECRCPGSVSYTHLDVYKRQELYRTNEEKFLPGFDIVVVARTRAIFGRYRELERSFLQQMKKLGLMAQSDKKEDRP